MNKKLLAGVVVAVVLAVSAFLILRSPQSEQNPTINTNQTFPESPDVPGLDTSTFGLPLDDDAGRPTSTSTPDIKSRFNKITNLPVAGFVPLGSKEKLDLTIRYMDKETGHIFDNKPDTSVAERVTNTTIPRVQKVLWDKTGANVVLQYLESDKNTLKTFAASLITKVSTSTEATTTTETKLDGVFLPSDISSLAYSTPPRAKNQIFYIMREGEGSVGYRTDLKASKLTAVFRSSFADWATIWKDKLYLYPKPTGAMEGHLYALNENLTSATETSLDKLFGGKLGLSPLPNQSGTLILFSEIKSATPELSVYRIREKDFVSLPLKTFVEKCVWSATNQDIFYCSVPLLFSGGLYPDDWYKGKRSFSDGLVSYDLRTGFFKILSVMERDLGEKIDATDLAISDDDSILLFKNKTDQSLWSFDIKP